jgi:hypothetical protein
MKTCGGVDAYLEVSSQLEAPAPLLREKESPFNNRCVAPSWHILRFSHTLQNLYSNVYVNTAILGIQFMSILQRDLIKFKQTRTLKNCVFWVVTPCGSCKNRRFGGTWRLLHQGDKNR